MMIFKYIYYAFVLRYIKNKMVSQSEEQRRNTLDGNSNTYCNPYPDKNQIATVHLENTHFTQSVRHL